MKRFIPIWLLIICCVAATVPASSPDFGLAENALDQFRAVRYENVYTKVPTTGKLVSLKISDNGKVYYICRENSGYVIYHLDIRPVEGHQEKIQQELKEKWDRTKPNDLLLTKEQYDQESKRLLNRHSDAVWVRNEIVIPGQ